MIFLDKTVSHKCNVSGCRDTMIEVVYLGKPLCSKHWKQHCMEEGK